MYRTIVSYIFCMLYFLRKRTIIIKISKSTYFSYIDIIISVYGIMFINTNIIDIIIIRLFLDLKLCWFYNYWQHRLYIGL